MSNEIATQINQLIEASEAQFVSTIGQYKWELIPSSQLQAAKQALTKSDYISKVACSDPEAVHDALVKSAILGLDLTEGKRQGWLLPRKNAQGKTVIQLQVGYKGVEAIHQRMGVIDRLVIRVVREHDEFDWSGEDTEKPTHKADWFANDEARGRIKGAFAITYYPDGVINVIVTSVSQIFEKHRDVSDSWKSYQAKLSKGENAYPPPWVTYEQAMIEKTMAYIASKQWPANIRNQEHSSRIIETLNEVDYSDYSSFRQKYTQEQKDMFYQYINGDDCLGLFLFGRYMQDEYQDEWVQMCGDHKNTIPRGGKGKEAQRIEELQNAGENTYLLILESIQEKDFSGIAELLDGCLDKTISFLKRRFNAEQLSIFNEYEACASS